MNPYLYQSGPSLLRAQPGVQEPPTPNPRLLNARLRQQMYDDPRYSRASKMQDAAMQGHGPGAGLTGVFAQILSGVAGRKMEKRLEEEYGRLDAQERDAFNSAMGWGQEAQQRPQQPPGPTQADIMATNGIAVAQPELEAMGGTPQPRPFLPAPSRLFRARQDNPRPDTQAPGGGSDTTRRRLAEAYVQLGDYDAAAKVMLGGVESQEDFSNRSRLRQMDLDQDAAQFDRRMGMAEDQWGWEKDFKERGFQEDMRHNRATEANSGGRMNDFDRRYLYYRGRGLPDDQAYGLAVGAIQQATNPLTGETYMFDRAGNAPMGQQGTAPTSPTQPGGTPRKSVIDRAAENDNLDMAINRIDAMLAGDAYQQGVGPKAAMGRAYNTLIRPFVGGEGHPESDQVKLEAEALRQMVVGLYQSGDKRITEADFMRLQNLLPTAGVLEDTKAARQKLVEARKIFEEMRRRPLPGDPRRQPTRQSDPMTDFEGPADDPLGLFQ